MTAKDESLAPGGKDRSSTARKELRARILRWLAFYFGFSAVVLGVLLFWAWRQAAAWGGLGAELSGYLPILVMFAPPIIMAPLLWRWLR
jgi:hypothetical protein